MIFILVMNTDFFSQSDKRTLFRNLMEENPDLKSILKESVDTDTLHERIREMVIPVLEGNPTALSYYRMETHGREACEKLTWKDFAAIRILDYIDHSGMEIEDLNLHGETVKSEPFRWLWEAYHGKTTNINSDFLRDMIYLFRQLKGIALRELPGRETVIGWMKRHPSGLDEEIIALRKQNKDRIIRKFIEWMDKGEKTDPKYFFEKEMSFQDKYDRMVEWWDERLFHLRFAIRAPERLNAMLDGTLSKETMVILEEARQAGIPTFVNPYYLSLLLVNPPEHLKGTDEAIREYVLYSRKLVDEFGHLVAWEKEDEVEDGKPNVAGWLLPRGNNIHRRYPEVSILIPDTMGRACGGLCASCQRMFDFQSGNLNFNLNKLLPGEKWPQKLERLMKYFEEDAQLRDILITGGDALMSSNKSLQAILDAVYRMAVRKKEANRSRVNGEKHAEIQRVRLGTRLPVYLPQRITDDLVSILAEFKNNARRIGIRQFVIQTHFETALEITPESKRGLEKLLSAGWIVTNQQVFTAGASRRGHTAKLRKVLNDTGVLPYYTFTVKGYRENSFNFATNERALQEQNEEKIAGLVPREYYNEIRHFPDDPENMDSHINNLREKTGLPFLATDRNVLNLPGVGKSLTYKTIGITPHGRRILEFDHDHTRKHSPIIEKMGKVVIVETKSVSAYLRQLESFGENIKEYIHVYGYSAGETEPLIPIYKYPGYEFEITENFTNLDCSK